MAASQLTPSWRAFSTTTRRCAAQRASRRVCQGLECLDLLLDTSANDHIGAGEEGLITREDSKLKAYVIPTNEELLIARDTYRVVSGQSAQVR